ncbi:probable inactive purple acid phosphatase 28 [Impatiens glandulifera]|uniref:probable inactive purple acid phosphatase 28 n=1 Tax=Impatiens glandulifera TaxID=253017 RepID=UPI001FB16428|nr:probable inactive purple acid phosphatase 28 [Impatiens glandulifera]
MMDPTISGSSKTSIFPLLYLTSITLFLYLLQTLVSDHLTLRNDRITLKKQPDLPLRFRADGTFKILQVADLHYGNGIVTRCRDVLPSEFDTCSDLNSILFLKRMIEAEKPDFVAFTGDNIFGSSASDAAESMFEVFGPVMESRLPWAAILGNHDQESTMTRQELMFFISLMDYSVSQTNPSSNNTIDGFGNYNLEILGPSGTHLANQSILNLYFLDSGDRAIVGGIRTYGWIKESQLNWLHGVSKSFHQEQQRIEEGFCPPPALAFFHIPILEMRGATDIVGHYAEYVASSIVHSGVLESFVRMGDVKGVFMGHDHTNDFCGKLGGIWFCYGGGFGYHGYGKAGWPRRSRVIMAELGNKGGKIGVEKIRTWKRLDDLRLSKIDEQVLWER